MPTCETATVKIDDRGKKFSSPKAKVKFIFDDINPRFIKKIEILESSSALKTPSKKSGQRASGDDSSARLFGSCDAGAGSVIVNGGSEERLFLITKFKPKAKDTGGESCCEATEVLLAKNFKQMKLDEVLLLLTRLVRIMKGDPPLPSCDDSRSRFK
jgi:hypothetical protein